MRNLTTIRTRAAAALPLLLAAAAGLPAPVVGPAEARAQQLAPDSIRALVDASRSGALATYRELLSHPNDAHRPEDILRLVGWLEAAFADRGFTTERLPTPGSPLLLAERPAPVADRTVLVYLQADGQPVEPSAWDQESPWTPVLKERGPDGAWREIPWGRAEERTAGGRAPDPDWRVFARSAADSKGPIRIRTSGGSVPISPFVATLGVPAVSVPTVNPDNNQHSPNENLRLGDFLRGIETMVAVLTTPVEPGATRARSFPSLSRGRPRP